MCVWLGVQNENKFMCPCHGSQYNAQGKVVRGPAPLVSPQKQFHHGYPCRLRNSSQSSGPPKSTRQLLLYEAHKLDWLAIWSEVQDALCLCTSLSSSVHCVECR